MVPLVEARCLLKIRSHTDASSVYPCIDEEEHGAPASEVVSTTADESLAALGAPAQGEDLDMSLVPSADAGRAIQGAPAVEGTGLARLSGGASKVFKSVKSCIP